jgi:hypothetical protein
MRSKAWERGKRSLTQRHGWINVFPRIMSRRPERRVCERENQNHCDWWKLLACDNCWGKTW